LGGLWVETSPGKKDARPNLQNNQSKTGWGGVAQKVECLPTNGEASEFKPQYHKIKTNNQSKTPVPQNKNK
jgi:hypothetical protein